MYPIGRPPGRRRTKLDPGFDAQRTDTHGEYDLVHHILRPRRLATYPNQPGEPGHHPHRSRWREQAERPNLTQIEDVALDLRARFGQELAATALADQDAKQPAEAPACPTCGETTRYKGQKGLDAESRLGLLEIARGYYYCARCHSGLFPPGPPA